MAQVEFFFDCSSPWTYLGFCGIQELAAETGAALVWRPILVGGVFNEVNTGVYEQRANPVPQKAHYYTKDLQDWARSVGIAIGQPKVFPVNSVRAMRGVFVAEEHGLLEPYVRAVFEAYWGDGLDISQASVLSEIAGRVGLDPDELLGKVAQPGYKARLRQNTDELIRRGGFGSPTFFVDTDDMYFGNDRLPLVRRALLSVG
jgi:2-hydroxychromene-2-carboxylate isomerase